MESNDERLQEENNNEKSEILNSVILEKNNKQPSEANKTIKSLNIRDLKFPLVKCEIMSNNKEKQEMKNEQLLDIVNAEKGLDAHNNEEQESEVNNEAAKDNNNKNEEEQYAAIPVNINKYNNKEKEGDNQDNNNNEGQPKVMESKIIHRKQK